MNREKLEQEKDRIKKELEKEISKVKEDNSPEKDYNSNYFNSIQRELRERISAKEHFEYKSKTFDRDEEIQRSLGEWTISNQSDWNERASDLRKQISNRIEALKEDIYKLRNLLSEVNSKINDYHNNFNEDDYESV